MTLFKTLFKTLNKNASSFTITDEAISDNSIFEVYPSDDSVILADVQVIGTTANIVFDSTAEYNIPCAVFINNLVGAYPPEIEHIDANNVYYENPFTGEQPIGSHFADLELNYEGYALPLLNNIDDELHTDTILGGVLYHSSTGNIWKKLDASNLDYDADSTIYSAMGDIDALETDSKNLVGAINEINSKTPESSTKFNNHCTSIEDILAVIPNIYDSSKITVSSNVSALLTKGDNTVSLGKLDVYRLSDTIFDYYGTIGDSTIYAGRYNNGSYVCRKTEGTRL